MSPWRQHLLRTAHAVERRWDALRFRWKKRLGRLGPVQIVPYRGYGTEEHVAIQGRVLEDKGLDKPSDREGVWHNLRAMYHRFESDEIPDVRVRARFQDTERVERTDDEGYFQHRFTPSAPLSSDRVWHEVELELMDEVVAGQGPVQATGEVLVPPPDCAFGVVSDIDDTVVKTYATNLMKMARVTFLSSARTRLPFDGVAGFYRALARGPAGSGHNPIFYVSSSPWNLYDLLVDFFELQGIPRGPLLLRDLGLDRQKFIKSRHDAHKRAQIDGIFDMYPDLPFILIGDSGQRDPEIYRQVAEAYPDRVLAIYIRDVTAPKRAREVHAIADAVHAVGTPMLLVEDTMAAAEHAAGEGWIREQALASVRAEKAKDEEE